MICTLWDTFARTIWHRLGEGCMPGTCPLFCSSRIMLFLQDTVGHIFPTLQQVISPKSLTQLHKNIIFLVQRQFILTLQANTGLCKYAKLSIKRSFPNTLGVVARLGNQSSMERGKILLSSKWEVDYFSLKNTFSSSHVAELPHSFYIYT